MAEITASLLWYRLGESPLLEFLNLVINAGGAVLNWIFVGWLFFGAAVVLYFTIHDLIEKQRLLSRPVVYKYVCDKCSTKSETNEEFKLLYQNKEEVSNYSLATTSASTTDSVSHKGDVLSAEASWADIIGFMSGSGEWKSQIIENCLNALSESSQAQHGELLMTFESVLPGAKTPTICDVNIISSSDDKLILSCLVDLSYSQLSVTSSDSTVSIQSNLLLVLQSIRTMVEVVLTRQDNFSVKLALSVIELQRVKIEFTPYYAEVDYKSEEQRLVDHFKASILRARLNFLFNCQPDSLSGVATKDPIDRHSITKTFSMSGPPKPPRSLGDKKLMIKLIKATKLNKMESVACDAYCTIEVDSPLQLHATSIVKNTVNPYWDEHFLFEMGSHTNLITFKVLNSQTYRAADRSNQFLGEAKVELDALRINHGMRQMLPLTSKSSQNLPVSGSITLECFFVDACEFTPSATTPIVDDVFSKCVEPLMTPSLEVTLDSTAASPMSTLDREPKLANFDMFANETQDQTALGQLKRASPRESASSNSLPRSSKLSLSDNRNIDLRNADVISVPADQTICEATLKELSSLPKRNGGNNNNTLIIKTTLNSNVMQPEILERAVSADETVKSTEEAETELPRVERRSRLSGLKKRFTRTKDKKPRSHSIERSSGIDRDQYLQVNQTDPDLGSSSPRLSPSSKRKFGSLRKLFNIHKRSTSSSRSSLQPSQDHTVSRISPVASLDIHSPGHLSVDVGSANLSGHSSPVNISPSPRASSHVSFSPTAEEVKM